MYGAAVTTLIALGAPASLSSAPPLPPSGKWVLEGQDNMCALDHAYGEGKDQVVFGFRPTPLEKTMDVIWFSHSGDTSVRDGVASISFAPSGKKLESAYTSYSIKGREQRLSSFTVDRGALDLFETASAVTVEVDGRRPVTIAPAGAKRAITELANCESLLLKDLGVDPTFRDRVAVEAKPIGSPQQWFKPQDYPPEARQGGAEGKTAMLLTIDIDGRIGNCVPFGRSGNAAIDKASCSKFIQRGRYKPAIGKDGQPMVSYSTQRVHWSLM